ncbi:hypothetical protein ACPPVO_30060 [Dactylosporangium sp. McL0621]|uniref:hypothetical protein n=1 Tax=Dactylosporangium sp. McL0621 TaxID=3415678 RepID=UPI003CEB6738
MTASQGARPGAPPAPPRWRRTAGSPPAGPGRGLVALAAAARVVAAADGRDVAAADGRDVAAADGRDVVSVEDVDALARPALAHRLHMSDPQPQDADLAVDEIVAALRPVG